MLETVRRILALPLLVLAAGLLGATLMRVAPGFDVDEQELDPRLSEGSRQAIRAERSQNNNVLEYYGHYLSAAARGDLGESRSLGRPVTELVKERFPVTARLAGWGLLSAWLVGLPLALAAAAKPDGWADLFVSTGAGFLLSVPAALVGIAFLYSSAWLPLATGLVLLPRIFGYIRNVLVKVSRMPHVLAARARGVSSVTVLWRHLLPVALPEILALGGISVNFALGASVPIEVLCDQPGIGQLAWQAALGRDLPVLVALTWIAATITLIANMVGTPAPSANTRQV